MTNIYKDWLRIVLAWGVCIGCLLYPFFNVRAAQTGPPSSQDDTMLMFVGLDLDVLSIASRREESARQAPAVANVITRPELQIKGIRTVADALSLMPGFHMAQKEWGSKPYLRGIPNSVLFLYDTVPMQSSIQKDVHPLDYELSMNAVKRIEIIRGPGSVLWGPDAFSGIVNVVPLTGKDIQGAETGVLYNSYGDQKGGYVSYGYDANSWDAFMSLSGRQGENEDGPVRVLNFWSTEATPAPVDERYGEDQPGNAKYVEAVGRFAFGDALTISGRYSDYQRPYVISADKDSLVWEERRDVPISFIKIEGSNEISSNSSIRATGYYASARSDFQVIDSSFSSSEDTIFGELVLDHRLFFGKGMFTGGVSYRNQDINNAPIWDSYLPDFLSPDNDDFLPLVTQSDYRANLWSFFSQYTHRIRSVKMFLGLRQDSHDIYKDNLSYSAGAVWSPKSEWTVKLLYGTAYRTPFARQLITEDNPDLEKIETLNLNIEYNFSDHAGLSLCGFRSSLSNHVIQDPYAGLSLPNDQDIIGVELSGRLRPTDELTLGANFTKIRNSGPDETYLYNDYSFFNPDTGEIEKHFTQIRYPFDPGPDTLFNITALWEPVKRCSFFVRGSYFSSQRLIYPREEMFAKSSGKWLIDASATIHDVSRKGLDLELSLKNLTDRDYQVPGTYVMMQGRPFSIELLLRQQW